MKENGGYPDGAKMTCAQLAGYRQQHPEDKRVFAIVGDGRVEDVTSDLAVGPDGNPMAGFMAEHLQDNQGVVSQEAKKAIGRFGSWAAEQGKRVSTSFYYIITHGNPY